MNFKQNTEEASSDGRGHSNPLATLAIYGFVFGILFGAKAPVGKIRPDRVRLVFVVRIIPWNFLLSSTTSALLLDNSALVRRVAFPREILVFSNVVLVQFGIEL